MCDIVPEQIMDEISYAGSSAPKKRKISKRALIFGILVIVILILLGSVAFFVTRGNDSIEEDSSSIILPEDELTEDFSDEEVEEEEEEVSPTKNPTSSPTPSKAEEAEEESASDEISIAVQNGSGESGVAGTASDILKKAGFAISSTGNADNFDYVGVTIQIKNSKKTSLKDIEDALSDDYTISDTSTDLSEGQSYDALVIIGK